MRSWTEIDWIPVERTLPTGSDGLPVLDGSKVAVYVLTVGMVINGRNPEARCFHVTARRFDDDEPDGLDRIMFWAPCWDTAAIEEYA